MKTYRITASCNPYHARFHYHGGRVLKRDGATPVKWVIEDGMTEEEALQKLWGFACEDCERNYANWSRANAESIEDMAQELAEDEANDLTIEQARELFDWFEGEGIYSTGGDRPEPVMLKGERSYSYDVMTYCVEEDE